MMIDHYLLYSYTTRLYLKKLYSCENCIPEEWTINTASAMKFSTRAEANNIMPKVKRTRADLCMIIPIGRKDAEMRNFRVKTKIIRESVFERQEVISGKSDLDVLNKILKEPLTFGDIAAVKIELYKKVKVKSDI